MKKAFSKHLTNASHLWPWIVVVLLVIALGYEIYVMQLLKKENFLIKTTNSTLEENLNLAKTENEDLKRQVRDHEYTIETFGQTIKNISSTVGTLEKLSKTDKELLMKYSKVYFLNENYEPARLTEISSEFKYGTDVDLYIHTDVWPHLRSLLNAANDAGHKLLVASAFRSYSTQATLKAGYTVTYGSGANRFSADQGYSEHQLGTTVDFTTEKVGAAFSKFSTDPVYEWLQDNAYKYGFILSYPEGNAYYKFEPWHWRFVGVELATKLNDDGKNFYELDQREIDEYLVKFFD